MKQVSWHRLWIWLSAVLVALSITSCKSHKDSDYTTKRRHWHTHRDEQPSPGSVDGDNWATLDVKLTRHDNKRLYEELRTWLGAPYKYGGKTRKGTDCSGMVMQVYQAVYDKALERNSARQFERNCKEISRKKLREGDLVFFNNGRSHGITHVGIYLRDGKFVHASSSRGVIVSDLSERYWNNHFQCAGRVE